MTQRLRAAAVGACAVAVAVLAGAAGPSAGTPRAAAETAVVAWVTDGDTVRLTDGRRVRLLQIDTPELGTGECYSRAARTALVRLAPPGARVTLEPDTALDQVDRYGRILRYLVRGGVNLDIELVAQGAAAPYFYGGARGRYAARLLAAAHAARAAGRGLWRACPGTVLDPERAVSTGRSGPATTAAGPRCDPNYAGGCVPPYPPDVDCADLRARGIAPVRVVGADPHRLDADHDGIACEDLR